MVANFYDEDGHYYMVRCTKCELENWAPAVASGQCAWCGYKHTEVANGTN